MLPSAAKSSDKEGKDQEMIDFLFFFYQNWITSIVFINRKAFTGGMVNPEVLVLYTVSLVKSLHRLIMCKPWHQPLCSLSLEKETELCHNWIDLRMIYDRSVTNLGLLWSSWWYWHTFTSISTPNRDTEAWSLRTTHPSLPEVAVGVYDPHSKALDPLLLSSNTFMAAKHTQGEFVDSGLQHGSKVPLEVTGLVLLRAIVSSFACHIAVEQAIGISCVVVVVSLDQGEERLGQIAPLVCLWRRRSRWGWPLGAAPPPGEAEAAPASIPGCLGFVRWALVNASALFGTARWAGHFWTCTLNKVRGLCCPCDLARQGLGFTSLCCLL